MNTNLKKIIPLLGLAAFLATTPVIGYDDDDHMSESHKAQHAVPPAQYPPGEDNLIFFIGAAYTFWVPYQEGMNFIETDGLPGNGASEPGRVFRPQMNGCSGFKVGLGANTKHDGWNVALNYAWFFNPTSMRPSNFSRDQGECNCIWFGLIDTYNSAQSRFNNQFNRIDGIVDRSFYAGHYLAFRPWMGLLGAWENQNFDFDVDNTAEITFTDTTRSFRGRQDWWGIGPYAGIDSTYYFTNEWGLYLSAGGAILLANHEIQQHIIFYNNDGGVSDNQGRNVRSNLYNGEPMLETSLGLRWDSFWTDWALRVEIAWEMQTYFSHNGFHAVNENAGVMGNYSMQGLTAGMRVNF